MTENYFLKRKSCRIFSSKKIDTQLLEDIILKAAKAPTCGNMQLYSIIVTQDEENLKRLAPFHFNQPAAVTSSCILTICADFNRFTKWCEINKADAGYDNFHSFITALTDAVIVAQQIVTIAEQEGLGSCYLGTVTYNSKEISELLKLPALVVPVASVALGYIKEEGEETKRLPIEGILHYERYHENKDKEIAGIFKVHDDDPANEKFIKENNKQNLAQVFAEVRYPKSLNENVSASFLKLLKEKKFFK